MKPLDPGWILPDWPAPANVKAFVTTRAGGVSQGQFESFNIGVRTGDDALAVAANRDRLRESLPDEPKWLRQVHGSVAVDADGLSGIQGNETEADASVARRPGTVCVIQVADCVPVLFAGRGGGTVAAAHAGWRGLARGVLENTVERTALEPDRLMAYLGPGIGPRAFEVGADVRDAFIAHDAGAEAAFTPHAPGKWMADIYQLARQRLAALGVTRVYGGGFCTYSDPKRFYSYRREKTTGRMAALIWIQRDD
jgi:purine-nucleoside/S-methyl-5'-thioadenosine phosphorylase / adenosine deaminase